MELRVLRYFLMAAREQSISGAANRLHVTQPTLSRQLMDLEAELGVKLFNRGGHSRKLTLTEEGSFLRKRAEEILELADRTEAEFASPAAMIAGDVYIGGGETKGMRLIARTAKKMQEKYPNIRFHLYSGNADDVCERLDKGLLDFGVLIEPADVSKYEYLSLPATDTWGLLMRRDHPLAKKGAVCAEDLEDLPLIVSRQSAVSNLISGWLGMDPEKLKFVGTYNLINNAALLVEEGMGNAVCLDKIVHEKNEAVCFVPFSPHLESRLDIVWKRHTVFSKVAAEFLKELRVEIRNEK